MAILKWDEPGEHLFETGVEKCVLYPYDSSVANDKVVGYKPGVAWNGITQISENPSGAEPTPLYADNIKYLNLLSTEEFGATIEAYTYPDEFAKCDGSAAVSTGVYVGQQKRQSFGLCYKTQIGNEVDGSDHGYKLHLIYGCLASPSEKGYATINDSPEAITFSWEVTTTPVIVTTKVDGKDLKPTANITIDMTKLTTAQVTALEGKLYGTATADPELPLPDDLFTLISSAK